MKKYIIILYSFITIALLYFVDQIIQVNYLLKVSLKLLLMGGVFFINQHLKTNMTKNFFTVKKIKTYKIGLFLSILSFISIFIGFLISRSFIDFSTLRQDFFVKYELTGIKFIIASIYLVLVNSFLEEYFFRGFIFYNLNNKYIAHITSSTFFAVYHLANFINWFEHKIFLLFPLTGLIVGGIIFNLLIEKSKDLYNAWLVHLTADVAIVIIGIFILF